MAKTPGQKETGNKGPLEGIRVLDLTRLYPGPMATQMLADMGAQVIKLESGENPDLIRQLPPFQNGQSALFQVLNRSKKSLGLNLKSSRGKEILLDLAKQADLFIEGFRPGVLAAEGLGYDALKAVNPRLVYLSLTGYGQNGPYRDQAGHDINYIGYAGILGANGNQGTGPMAPGVQMADVAGGAYMAVIAALAALFSRNKTGKGQYLDVAMLDSVLPLMTLPLTHQWNGMVSEGRGEMLLSGASPCYGVYRCKDRKYVALGALEPKFWTGFCQLVDRPQWVPLQFASGVEKDHLDSEMESLFLTRTRDQWVAFARDSNLCLSPVAEMDEVARDPQLRHRNMVVTVPDQEGGDRPALGFPLKFSGAALPDLTNPAPKLGQDSLELLKDAQLGEKEIEALLKAGVVQQA